MLDLEALRRIEDALAVAASHTPWTVSEWEQLKQAREDARRLIEEAKGDQ